MGPAICKRVRQVMQVVIVDDLGECCDIAIQCATIMGREWQEKRSLAIVLSSGLDFSLLELVTR